MNEERKPWGLPAGLENWLAPVLRASRRRLTVFLVCLGLAGAMFLLFTKPASSRLTTAAPAAQAPAATGESAEAERLAADLAEVVSRIAGAGEAMVRLTLAGTARDEWEENTRSSRRTTEDRDPDGGVQVTTEESEESTLALAKRADGSEAPVERQAVRPEVIGALIIVDGAGDPILREEIARAAAVFLGMPLHRVIVLPREAKN